VAGAYQRALLRLARRDHSEAELRTALAREGFAKAEVDGTLSRLRRERLIDDSGYASRFARSRMAHHGLGRYRVHQALRRRGVPSGVAEAGIREALVDVPEAAVLEAVARRYWRQRSADEPRRRLRKLWAFLLRRGFPPDLVRERLRLLLPRHGGAIDELHEETGGEGVGE
jgi:regulatory protein